MNKRMISFFLTVMLVVATICQPIAAAPKAEKTAERELNTEWREEAVTISENACETVDFSEELSQVVYKFVPQETKEYNFFSFNSDGDPKVVVSIGEDEEELFEYDDHYNWDFEGCMELTAGTEYYFRLIDLQLGSYQFMISSEYDRIGWVYKGKTVASVSMSDIPDHEFWDYESKDVSADIPVQGMTAEIEFTDGEKATEYISDASHYEYDDNGRIVATYFKVIKDEYKVYWDKIKEVDDTLYMDETVENFLCIEDKNGKVEKYPVVIHKTDIGNLEVKSAPSAISNKNLINSNNVYDMPLDMDGLVLTVTRADGTKYDLIYICEFNEENDDFYYHFVCTEEEQILDYSFDFERDEYGRVCMGDNILTIQYGGKTTEIPVFLYEVVNRKVLNPIHVKQEIYPFGAESISLKGLKLQMEYSDGTSRVEEVTEDISELYIDGYYANVTCSEGIVYLRVENDIEQIQIGTYEEINRPISSYPGIGDMNPDVPFDVVVNEDKEWAVYRYTPEVTTEYRIYSAPGNKSDSDPYVEVYTDTSTSYIANADDDNDRQFDLTTELKAGTTYYFVFKSFQKPETFRVTLESTYQLPQVITAPATITKKMDDAPFALGAKAYGNATMTYASSNPAVAAVDAKGMVTIKSAGTTTITINAAQTKSFTAATKKVTLTVNKIPVAINAADTITKAYGSKKFSLKASGVGKMTYSSSNTKVATVDKNGKVTVKKCGKVVITIKATADGYLDGEKKVVINVVPKKAKIKSAKSSKAGQITVKWNCQKEAKGYIIEYSTDKNFKKNVKSVKVKKNSTTSKTIKKLKKGKKYYVRVKAYVTIDKKSATGAASSKKNVKIKK